MQAFLWLRLHLDWQLGSLLDEMDIVCSRATTIWIWDHWAIQSIFKVKQQYQNKNKDKQKTQFHTELGITIILRPFIKASDIDQEVYYCYIYMPNMPIYKKLNFIMDWINNLCSCISPTLKSSIIDYLNSSKLNSQVIQQQKCTEQDRDQEDPGDHVYKLAKSKSYNFMKLQENSDDENDSPKRKNNKNNLVQEEENQENDQIMDVFWYPVKKAQNKWQQYRSIFTHKSNILQIILGEQPSSSNYDKVYDSQDQIKLVIYCRLESLIKGKKINSYRFSFEVENLSVAQFKQWMKQAKQSDIIPLLSQKIQIQKDPQDSSLCIEQKHFKKLLVINPHYFTTAQKIVIKESQQKNEIVKVVSFSVKQQHQKQKQKQKIENQGNGWLHLFGLQIFQRDKSLVFIGYMSIELQVSISPSMLKQPISKQIRISVQKLICNLRKSDQI